MPTPLSWTREAAKILDRENRRMTEPEPRQPATAAGRALLALLDRHGVTDDLDLGWSNILAIEAEARQPSPGLRALKQIARGNYFTNGECQWCGFTDGEGHERQCATTYARAALAPDPAAHPEPLDVERLFQATQTAARKGWIEGRIYDREDFQIIADIYAAALAASAEPAGEPLLERHTYIDPQIGPAYERHEYFPPVAGPASEPWVQGDIEPTAILRGGIVRYRVMATGNPKDAEEGTAMIVTALNARPPVAGPDAGLREASGLLADAVRRYFDEHEAKAVVNMQPLVERIEALVAGPDAGERE